MGREAAAFMRQQPAASPKHPEGEVLVIEIDGKCPPTATEEELAKRRGRRRPRHERTCRCGCQRHRGRARRLARGSKKRRKRGDKSKNGREAVVVVMYTLGRGADGQLHGPLNKKLYATFAGRQAAALWARAEATKRGFGPDTTKTVQLVMDGAKSLKGHLQPLFPKAIFTLDVCHVVGNWGRFCQPSCRQAFASQVYRPGCSEHGLLSVHFRRKSNRPKHLTVASPFVSQRAASWLAATYPGLLRSYRIMPHPAACQCLT
jgi:transposase